jgi:hypothetical protein
MSYYIQRKGQGYLETVDEVQDRREAARLVREYQLADPSGFYYRSQRPCRAWVQA